MQLLNKTVLVTGAGRGIGKAIALGFAAEGADVVVAARTPAEIEDTARRINSLGRQALAVQADVSRLPDVQRMTERTRERFGRLDVLVNNAALRMNQLGKKDSYQIPFVELTLDDWDSAINVNLRGPFLCIRDLLPLLRAGGGGSIINISAGGGRRGMAGRVPYCASKFGLEGLTQSLALEFKAFNIAVNSLSPGRHSVLTDTVKVERLKEAPGTIYMKPEMMVPPAVHLARQDGAGETGRHVVALDWLRENRREGIEEWKVRL
jgi:3-oxoacyl-[acyl-carrier protein] reductase